MSTSTDIALADHKKRADALERVIRRLVVAVIALSAAIVVVAVVVALMYLERDSARDYYNTQIKKLVCLVPPGKPVADQLRHQVGCGAYVKPKPVSPRQKSRASGRWLGQAPAASRPPAVHTAASITHPTRAPHPPLRHAQRPTQPHQPAPTPAAQPSATPQPTPTRTPTATHTPTVTPTPGPIRSVVCTILTPLCGHH